MNESKTNFTVHGNPLTLEGAGVKVGEVAPDFTAAANDLSPFSLSSLKGKPVLIVAVTSLDTSVCDVEARRFNQEATSLSRDLEIVVVSMDLPFAQGRWCGAAGVDRIVTVSDHRDASFGLAYGVLIKELRLLARSLFLIDPTGVIRYKQIVSENTNEPDYDEVLEAIGKL